MENIEYIKMDMVEFSKKYISLLTQMDDIKAEMKALKKNYSGTVQVDLVAKKIEDIRRGR